MCPYLPHANDALIQDPRQDGWMLFRRPVDILVAQEPESVLSLLQRVDRALEKDGIYAAGFMAYEAAPGLDPALKTKTLQSFPLAWFGIYQAPVVLDSLPEPEGPGSLLSSFEWSASVDRLEYDRSIEKVKDYIAQGDTYQVNYTYRLRARFQGDPYAAFYDLAMAQKAKYTAFIYTDCFTLCSASPELFFSLDGDLLTSKPMKGTAARGRTFQEDLEYASWLRGSLKDQAENVMIVDMVRNDIGKIARIGSVQVRDLYAVEKYPTVWQMVSTVSGETKAGLCDIFQALFPPASITGAPKARTMEIIQELENSPRKIYTGCIGYAGPNRTAQFNVSIRTMLVDNHENVTEYGIGGGITWGSVDSAEYEESRAKARILTVRMPRFSLLESLLWEPQDGYFLLDEHLDRLYDSADYFSFKVDIPTIRQELERLACSFSQQPQKVRLLVDEKGRATFEADPIQPVEEGSHLKVCLASEPVNSADPFLFHKTNHRQVYEQARLSCQKENHQIWDEVLLWNERGEVTEASMANIAFAQDGELFTPPVSCGLLPGTYRAWLLKQGKIKEKILRIEDLKECSRFFLINSVRRRREARLLLKR
jgi:para-aminobenzoate synthetase / 4-amino-4-deoxychorismate lyase